MVAFQIAVTAARSAANSATGGSLLQPGQQGRRVSPRVGARRAHRIKVYSALQYGHLAQPLVSMGR